MLDLKDVLYLMGKRRMVNKKEMDNILKDIEIRDNTTVKGKEDITEIFEDTTDR